ncbi:hypothetical protein ANCCAN_06529 [Ancylostoma caninum]|uniref:Uncharacterized protein n=1 Tax=Ancylostoma caninum TaxID=29170 RepID=A0A368GWK2_ANCCA|nr:hypothetical protein ANCCAN_06529 [Ancylostoma caninum]
MEKVRYSHVSRERVEALRKYSCDNISQFALDLEKVVCEDKPGELLLRARDRLETAGRMKFIKKCVFNYFRIPEQAEATT